MAIAEVYHRQLANSGEDSSDDTKNCQKDQNADEHFVGRVSAPDSRETWAIERARGALAQIGGTPTFVADAEPVRRIVLRIRVVPLLAHRRDDITATRSSDAPLTTLVSPS